MKILYSNEKEQLHIIGYFFPSFPPIFIDFQSFRYNLYSNGPPLTFAFSSASQ